MEYNNTNSSNNINTDQSNLPTFYKLYTESIDNIRSNKQNQISLSILNKIKDDCKYSILQANDEMNRILGSSLISSKIVESKELSTMMTNLFENTKVKVYIYISLDTNAFTLPGTNIMSTPFSVKVQSILSSNVVRMGTYLSSLTATYVLSMGNLFTNFLNILEQCITSTNNIVNKDIVSNSNINSTTKKISIPNRYVTMYVSSNLIKLINNDNELTAILLHEIGHNVNLGYTIIEELLSNSWLLSVVVACYYELKSIDVNSMLTTNIFNRGTIIDYDSYTTAEIAILISIIVFLFSIFMSAYISRKNEIYSDEFAIKVGYGKYLYSVVKKLHNLSDELVNYYELQSKKEKAKKSEGVYMKIVAKLSKLLEYLNTYPSNKERERLILTKTQLYNNAIR